MKITRRQLRKLIMEMPMGGYFGSMHGGAGDDFISAVEVEAMKYPDHAIYIDDASNNPNEFMISSSRRDDAQGPQSHYLTSIHVDVYERDGMIYVDGQPFSNYSQAAAKILSDLEDERQYSIMSESVYKDYETKKLMDRLRGIKNSDTFRKVNTIDPPDASIENKKQARELAIALGSLEDESPFLDIKAEQIEKYMFLLHYSFLYAYMTGHSNSPNDPISKKDLFDVAKLVVKLKPHSQFSLGKKLPKNLHKANAAFDKMIRAQHIVESTPGSGMYIFNTAMRSKKPYS